MRLNAKNQTITLGRDETRTLEHGDGPEQDALGRLFRRAAKEMAERLQKPVEVYAARSFGGYCITQVIPEGLDREVGR